MPTLAPDTRLRDEAAAAALTAAGFPIARLTLRKLRSVGGGPPYEKWGRIPIYTWGPTLAWAKARCTRHGEHAGGADASAA